MSYIWVSGASSGIGRALTEELLTSGFKVFATARRIELLDDEFCGIYKDKGQLVTKYCDVEDKKSVADAFLGLKEKTGETVSILINNAGSTSFTLASDESLEIMEKIMQVNYFGAVYCIRSVLPDMISAKSGKIVNILSVAARKVLTKSSSYSASKSALQAYADVLREEVRRHNIQVTNIYPGATATPIWSESMLSKNSERMMNAADVAKNIIGAVCNASTAVPEELVLRPSGGDL